MWCRAAALALGLVLGASACKKSADGPAADPNRPCQPGPDGPPVTTDHPLPRAYGTCEQACWDLEYMRPPGGGMPSGVSLVSCVFNQARTGVRCVVQHERLCMNPNTPY